MKKILIIEDEQPAAKRLRRLLQDLEKPLEVLAVIDSVEDAVAWLKTHGEPDLTFFDIQLADGQSFSIFEQVEVKCPVIFTTAYDQYAIKAFQVNSIDYLLKPIEPEALQRAWQKFESLHAPAPVAISEMVTAFQQLNQQKNYRERFLIKKGETFKYITIDEVAYFFSDGGLTFLMDQKGSRYVVDDKLDILETIVDPRYFFRVNRKFIIRESSIKKISAYFNSRLILEILPSPKEDIIVARERVGDFKQWLNA